MSSGRKGVFPSAIAKETLTTVAGFTALVYVLGYLVTNAFLFSFGVVTDTLLSSRYLASGICFAVFYAVAGLVFVIVPGSSSPSREWDAMVAKRAIALDASIRKKLAGIPSEKTEEYRAGYEKGYRASYGFMYSIGYGIGYVLRIFKTQLHYYIVFLLICLVLFTATGSDLKLVMSPFMILWTVIVTLGVSLGVDLRREGPEKESRLVPWILTLLILSVVLYGNRLFPHISPSVGGGMPMYAAFIVSDEDKDLVETALDQKLDNVRTPVVKLLLETSETYVVMIRRGNTEQLCQIKKELVKAVLHEPRGDN